MNTKDVICSQYFAALEMLKMSVIHCPASLWDDPADKNKFWHVAYHVLFYTHLYAQPSEKDFRPWANHRENYHSLGELPNAPIPYTKEDILAYFDVCRKQVEEKVAILDLEAESGFPWLPFNKLELQFYNIRHIQQHTGELMERLGTRAQIDVEWVGMKHD
jgi:hypothetical protein